MAIFMIILSAAGLILLEPEHAQNLAALLTRLRTVHSLGLITRLRPEHRARLQTQCKLLEDKCHEMGIEPSPEEA